MAREIFIDQIADAHAAVQATVAELEAGELVCLPDECGWHLVGLATRENAGAALAQANFSGSELRAISMAHPAQIVDYVSNPSRLLLKLTARCWPGPVVFRVAADSPAARGLIDQWPMASRRWGVTEQGRAFYCPAETYTQEVLRSVSSPVLSFVGSGEIPDFSKAAVEPSLIVRSSLARFSAPPTVASLDQSQFSVEKSGVVSERMLARLAGEVYLFICTGNTCRSPMAEALFRKMLADRLKCREDELMDHGFVVISAGLAAYKGAPAAPESVELLSQSGIDLSGHESQPVTEELLFHCDHIVTMTRSHRDAVLSSYPELASQVRLLSHRSEDVPDPIGAGMDEYQRCREVITQNLMHLLEEIEATGREGNGT